MDRGIELGAAIKKEKLHNLEVFFIEEHAVGMCFEAEGKISEELCFDLSKRDLQCCVFTDAGFKDSTVKRKVKAILLAENPNIELRII